MKLFRWGCGKIDVLKAANGTLVGVESGSNVTRALNSAQLLTLCKEEKVTFTYVHYTHKMLEMTQVIVKQAMIH